MDSPFQSMRVAAAHRVPCARIGGGKNTRALVGVVVELRILRPILLRSGEERFLSGRIDRLGARGHQRPACPNHIAPMVREQNLVDQRRLRPRIAIDRELSYRIGRPALH